MTAPFLYGIYCDDIRQEVGNKLTFVGIYSGGELIFPIPFPAVIPKLCVVATFVYPKSEPPREIEFKVSLEGNEVARAMVQPPPDHQRSIFDGVEDGYPRRATIQASFFLSPLTIEKESILRLEANVDGTRFFGPRLLLQSQPAKDTSGPQ
ncbi:MULTISPECIES: hypothetical protein [Ralstonia]|jgi:hypothetical protein|uniref:Uncharacterized protein n=1 Tax=Ralstonia pickettii OR214 TaxID=1264675 RepID=R0DPY5_RALPI|nr:MULTISPECIES: hypothetical protein [Ralstonia]ENZ75598.1 hypothetical protein OR214_04583 [Ralstonia pickettii OR214]MBL4778721.1 hypothetical protein [Ralstonia sp.]MCM3583363.1 hypothetical protein [Ralstonia pickettii]MDR9387006.1 hypothetical protein [Ralstonia sp. 11b]OYU20987.1 MAG: hypothetical protein CFE42_21815 [Ralstonia sp. PBBBR1]